jgi:cell division control protein 6
MALVCQNSHLNLVHSLLILDELDHISPSAGSLASLFSMVHDNRSSIRVIGIANTHTMTSIGALFDGVAGVDTLHFAAYSGQDLLEIIQTRLGPLYDDDHVAAMKKFLPLPALTLLGKKVAAQTGDVRAVFEVLRGAIDAAVMASSVTDAPAVSPAHVLSALKLYSPASTNTVTALPGSSTMSIARAGNSQLAAQVRQLGLQQRLVLLAIVLSMHRLQAGLSLGASTPALFPSVTKSPTKRARSAGSASLAPAAGSMDSSVLYTFYSSILVRGDGALFNPVPRSEFIDLLGMLETVGLISLSAPSGPRQISRTTSLKNSPSKAAAVGARAQDVKLSEGVRADEVLRGLGCQDVTEVAAADSREEEVLAIFDREQARITREVRNRTQSTSADVFSEATED